MLVRQPIIARNLDMQEKLQRHYARTEGDTWHPANSSASNETADQTKIRTDWQRALDEALLGASLLAQAQAEVARREHELRQREQRLQQREDALQAEREQRGAELFLRPVLPAVSR